MDITTVSLAVSTAAYGIGFVICYGGRKEWKARAMDAGNMYVRAEIDRRQAEGERDEANAKLAHAVKRFEARGTVLAKAESDLTKALARVEELEALLRGRKEQAKANLKQFRGVAA